MSANDRIYLDFNASTPVAPEVHAAMAAFLEGGHGNPSSSHWAGLPAKAAVETARGQVAALLGVDSDEVYFTSGGTEANNWAIKGAFFRSTLPYHIVSSTIEHPATLEPIRFLERLGASATLVGVDRRGELDMYRFENAVFPETRFASLMFANNETGVIQPIADVGAFLRGRSILFHVDAAQAVGKIPVRPRELCVDLLSIAGHKLYAPKGVGALYIRKGIEPEPLLHGAGHERGRRAGTEAVSQIVGLGAACELAGRRMEGAAALESLRDRFWDGLRNSLGEDVVLFGDGAERLPNTLYVGIRGRLGSELLRQSPGIAASTGSACHSGVHRLSPVLEAMGVDPQYGIGAVRFSLGWETTRAEVDSAVRQMNDIAGRDGA